MAVRLQFIPGKEPPDLLDLPWATALADWDHPRLVRMAAGVSRHVVRFVSDGERVYALKETVPAELWLDASRMHLFVPASGENLTRDLLYATT